MNAKNCMVLLIAALLWTAGLQAQVDTKSFMIMAKPGVKNSYTYYPGQSIYYRMAMNNEFVEDRIVYFTDSTIAFAAFAAPYDEIDAIKIPKKTYVFSRETLVYSGVSMFGTLILWNIAYKVNQGEFAPETGSAALVFSAMLGGAIVINLTKKALTKQIYPIARGQYELRPVVFRPQVDESLPQD